MPVSATPRIEPGPGDTETPQRAPGGDTLPKLISTFVGRHRELAEVQALLAQSDIRLLTLTGPGGSGKTRLALKAAETAPGYDGARWFVTFAAIHDAALVPSTIAATLGIPVGMGNTIAHDLIGALRGVRSLVILDNFEQVHEASDLVSALLAECPELKILVTSRAVLRIPGEQVYAVPPLSLPQDDTDPAGEETLASDAVQLLVARAREGGSVIPDTPECTEALGAICRMLDGLPLAIELVAPWLRVLPPRLLLDRMDRRLPMLERGARNAPERQRTMRATIEWSYVLLAPEERSLLRRLSVFVGGFLLSAVEPVTGIPATELPERLGGLIDHSLVRRVPPPFGREVDEPRYFLFSTIREFGMDRLLETRELGDMLQRHAAWCRDLAIAAVRERMGRASTRAADHLAAERHNLRAAIEHLEGSGQIPEAITLAAMLWPLWLERGELTEGRRHLARLLAHPDATRDAASRAKGLQVLGMLCQAQGDLACAEEMSVEALALFERLGSNRGAGAALTTLGLVRMVQGEYPAAESLLERSLERFRAAGDQRAGSWALRHISSVAYRRGDLDAYERLAREGLEIVQPSGNAQDIARLRSCLALAAATRGRNAEATAEYEQVLALYGAAGDRWGQADALQRLGHLAYLRGDVDAADRLLADSARLLKHIGDPEGMVRVLCGQGWVARRRGDLAGADGRFGAALELGRAHGERRSIAESQLGRGAVALDRGCSELATQAWRESLALSVEIDDRIGIAAALEWIAHLADERTLRQGAGILGASAAIRDTCGAPTDAAWAAELDFLWRGLRSRLGAEAFRSAVGAGRAWSVEDTVAAADRVLTRAVTPLPALPPIGAQVVAVSELSAREVEVMKLLAEGYSDQRIADELSISRRTATTHVGHIFSKIGVASRAAAAAYAVRNGIV